MFCSHIDGESSGLMVYTVLKNCTVPFLRLCCVFFSGAFVAIELKYNRRFNRYMPCNVLGFDFEGFSYPKKICTV